MDTNLDTPERYIAEIRRLTERVTNEVHTTDDANGNWLNALMDSIRVYADKIDDDLQDMRRDFEVADQSEYDNRTYIERLQRAILSMSLEQHAPMPCDCDDW